jgi:hypothetical protein
MEVAVHTYTVRLARDVGAGLEAAAYTFDAPDDSLDDAGLLHWLTQFRVGAWPFFSVLEDGVETGLPVPAFTWG